MRGGTEIQTLNLVKCLKSLDHEISLICYFEHDPIVANEFSTAGASIILLDLVREIGCINFIVRLWSEIRKIKPEFVHVQYMAPGALPIIAARLAGVKNVFATVHQPYTRTHGRMAKVILRVASLLTTRFITVSENAERSWFGSTSLFDENMPVSIQPHHFTIYNGVDTVRIQKIAGNTNCEILKDNLRIPLAIPLIGIVSRLRYEKGIDLLVESFSHLIKDDSNSRLLIVGSGPDDYKLKKQADFLGISGRITFYGAAEWETAIGLMSIMDIVVVPSRFEGFGLTAAEAMSMGKPVVAADNFGLKEVVTDKETGLTFNTGDINDLKEKLKKLFIDPSLWSRYGASGQERAEKLFDISVFHRKIAALYNIYKQ